MENTKLCPSAPMEVGAKLLAIRDDNGKFHKLGTLLAVTDGFVSKASMDDDTPESKMRFVSTCRESGCEQWQSGRCGVADSVVPEMVEMSVVQRCPVRGQCRWYNQSGFAACSVCDQVVTDQSS